MTFDDIPPGSAIFIDANILVYYAEPHPTYGPACQQLMSGGTREPLASPATRQTGTLLFASLPSFPCCGPPGRQPVTQILWSNEGSLLALPGPHQQPPCLQVEEVASMSDLLRICERAANELQVEDFLAREDAAQAADPTAPTAAGGTL